MTLRSNLFTKLFIAFWLLTITILGSWLLASNYFESQPPSLETKDHRPPGPPHRFILRMIYNLETADDAALSGLVADARKKHDIHIYLVNRDSADLLGRKVPTNVVEAAARLREASHRTFINVPRHHLAGYKIQRPDQGPISAVFIFPSHRGFILNVLGGNLSLRVLLAVLISGLVCFGLSKLMTNRLRDLQLASRRLANGELDTRLQVRAKGGDETDELARDFNTMAAQLQMRIQAQKRMLGDVSHELRSPLARLRIALALAQEKADNKGEYLQRIEQEAERLEELIGQLLGSQAQEICLDSHIDLVSLLLQLCADANFEGQGQGKEFIFSTDTEQAIVVSSSDLLRKSFENILRNALHHTAANSRVRVALASTGESFEIEIEDQGPGVPEQDLESIFSEFFRIDSARTRESGGFGLGLAIARRAVEQHGGKVAALNTGSGLKVIVSLPAHR